MLYATPFITAYALAVTALFGLCMGSFLTCLAWRMAHGESVLKGRSHCDSCGHVLAARDLVPVASWVFTHGRCRYCGRRISVRCPVTEVLCAVVYISIVMRYDLTFEAVEMLAFTSVLLVASLSDIDRYVIPNTCVVAAVVVRLLYIAAAGLFSRADAESLFATSLLGALEVAVPLVLLVLVMDHVLGRESMGGGDIKLLAVAGFYFGWQECLFLIIVACVMGIVVGLVQRLQDATAKEGSAGDDGAATTRLIPWGPSITVACWVTMLCGPSVVSWYL